MDAIIIKADKEGNELLLELARRLGASVLPLNEEQFEDIALGYMMDKAKTGELVDKESIMKKLG